MGVSMFWVRFDATWYRRQYRKFIEKKGLNTLDQSFAWLTIVLCLFGKDLLMTFNVSWNVMEITIDQTSKHLKQVYKH